MPSSSAPQHPSPPSWKIEMKKRKIILTASICVFYILVNLSTSWVYNEFAKTSAQMRFFYKSSTKEEAIRRGIFLEEVKIVQSDLKESGNPIWVRESWIEKSVKFKGKVFCLPFWWTNTMTTEDVVLVVNYETLSGQKAEIKKMIESPYGSGQKNFYRFLLRPPHPKIEVINDNSEQIIVIKKSDSNKASERNAEHAPRAQHPSS
jgi:hypothetical protein